MAAPKKRRKKAQDLTTEEAVKRIFHKPLSRIQKLVEQALSDGKQLRKQKASKSLKKL